MSGTAMSSNTALRTRTMVEGALCVALSVVFSSIVFFKMPQGGSITLEMAPLIYFSYKYGLKWGIGAGLMSGVLQLLFGGYMIHPVQAALDYPVAFGCMGLAGISRRHLIAGTLLACLGRLACHVASGVIFFAQYAPEWQHPFVYSLIYNASFMVPAIVISAVLAWLLWNRIGGTERER